MLINQFSVFANDIYLGTEQTHGANQNSMLKLKHRQYSGTHLRSRTHAFAQRNQKFENNNGMFAMDTGVQRERWPRPVPPHRWHSNGHDMKHQLRQRTNASSPTASALLSMWSRQRGHQRHRLQYQRNIISKNIIIKAWKKLCGWENVSVNGDGRDGDDAGYADRSSVSI